MGGVNQKILARETEVPKLREEVLGPVTLVMRSSSISTESKQTCSVKIHTHVMNLVATTLHGLSLISETWLKLQFPNGQFDRSNMLGHLLKLQAFIFKANCNR